MKGSDEWITNITPKMNYMTTVATIGHFLIWPTTPRGENMITPNHAQYECVIHQMKGIGKWILPDSMFHSQSNH